MQEVSMRRDKGLGRHPPLAGSCIALLQSEFVEEEQFADPFLRCSFCLYSLHSSFTRTVRRPPARSSAAFRPELTLFSCREPERWRPVQGGFARL
jgi:hypothetical protein